MSNSFSHSKNDKLRQRCLLFTWNDTLGYISKHKIVIMLAYIKLFSTKMNLTFISKRASFFLVLIKWFYVTLICLQLLLWRDREKKLMLKTLLLYCLSLVKGWVILILVLRCVGWIWYPFSFILRVIYISLFVLNKIICRKQIYQWIISTTKNNQNCIWFGGNFIQSRQTFLYGICLAQVKWSFYFLSGMKFLKSVP